ncbi:5-formyltetrahydrofolate cyclo-ligase [Rhizobium sp. KVB221]|uniref:5-formyltetrahydrofolate cyclo-ligase n=1 Tax=Rhizobium setariae TaxID=2801340 RepID=A0A936YVR4_9HYPH|nr:5-formyltetrahydrofolate cyclo-ligase [Rhizobium setariae]MBL0374746.1 5-formyltetrahydrofolate cyclo-ligase [Rhizobium setariae]
MHRDDAEETEIECASPPCLISEVDPAYMGLEDPQAPQRIYAWRKIQRESMIAARLSLRAEVRTHHASLIASGLDQAIGEIEGKSISLYWPFRGEPDLRPWMESVTERGGTCLLPIVIEKRQPLIFKSWKKGEPLGRGVWNIPIPESGPEMVPDVVIAPLVGFDAGCYRLGYGGGFFDRTLAALPNRPLVIGVGYVQQRMPTIHPLAHDIPMDIIVTEQATVRRGIG